MFQHEHAPDTTTTVSAPRWRRIAYLALRRCWELILTLDIEGAEIVSIVSALSWFIPLCVRPHYLSTSQYLQGVEAYVPRPSALIVAGLLLFWQTAAVILGGSPSGLINRPPDVCFWLRVRRIGLLAAGFVWIGLAKLLTPGVVSVGTFLWTCIALFCAFGFYRIGLFLAVEREVAAYQQREAEGNAVKSHTTHLAREAVPAVAEPPPTATPPAPSHTQAKQPCQGGANA